MVFLPKNESHIIIFIVKIKKYCIKQTMIYKNKGLKLA